MTEKCEKNGCESNTELYQGEPEEVPWAPKQRTDWGTLSLGLAYLTEVISFHERSRCLVNVIEKQNLGENWLLGCVKKRKITF